MASYLSEGILQQTLSASLVPAKISKQHLPSLSNPVTEGKTRWTHSSSRTKDFQKHSCFCPLYKRENESLEEDSPMPTLPSEEGIHEVVLHTKPLVTNYT